MATAKRKKAPAGKKASARTVKKAPAKAKATVQPIGPCLWFDSEAEEAAKYYVSIFKKGKIKQVSRYPDAGQEVHHRPAGSVLTVDFELNGTPFMALNGGPMPQFKFNEGISLVVSCANQKEVDYYWDKLKEGGDPRAQQCGWLKDKYGVSWQIVPEGMIRMLKDYKSPKTVRAFTAMMEMKKLDIAALEAAYAGK
jgi:predicted 3-demethylubiquinone-9 3-methyltransferase (glyoxalase superfamily)